MAKFFVSYNEADLEWAQWIAWHLEAADHEVILQAWDFRPGTNFILNMHRAAATSAHIIAVLTPDYLNSDYAAAEWATAVALDPAGTKGLLIPVRVRETDLTGLLPAIVYIDLVGLDKPTAKERLLSGVGRQRAKPKTEPRFPATSAAVSRLLEMPESSLDALAPIWNVPHLPNLDFTGRRDALAQIAAGLASGHSVALHGLAGVGKTQIAIQYAYRHAGEYDIVWWVKAENTDTVTADIAALAIPLQLPAQELKELHLIAKAVIEHLGHRQRWLLIFDRAPSAQHLRPFLPGSVGGHVLITSVDRNWRTLAVSVEIRPFTRDESVEFLLRSTGQLDRADVGSRASADVLAKELGDLPLALDHAAAYTEASERTLADYFTLFRSRPKELFQTPAEGNVTLGTLQDVAKTWHLNFLAVEETSSVAADLFNLCAFFASDAIPISLLQTYSDFLPPRLAAAILDDLTLDTAISTLLKYSLINVDRNVRRISVHTLVQFVARDELSNELRECFATAAVRLVNAAFPYLTHNDQFQLWPDCAALLPHALATLELAEKSLSTRAGRARYTSELLNKCALYLFDRAELHKARQLLDRALRIDGIASGSHDRLVARDLNNLGWVAKDMGQLASAQAYFTEALSINEAVLSPHNATVATALVNLSWVLKDRGNLADAKEGFERALVIDELIFGERNASVSRDCTCLGWVLEDLRDLQGARRCFERALAIDSAIFGLDHPRVARGASNLGRVRHALGDLHGAREYFEQALTMDRRTFGSSHPTVASDLVHMGSVFKDLGDFKAARQCVEEAHGIDEAVLGSTHPSVARDEVHMGMIWKDMGELREAEACFRRACSIDEAALGTRHWAVARDLTHLGSVLKDRGDLNPARECFERALSIDEGAFGGVHPTVAGDCIHLGWALKNLGDLTAAREYFERALTIHRVAFGPEDATVATDLTHLGWVLKDSGDLEGAKAHFERALVIDEKVYGPTHLKVARDARDLGWLLKDLGNVQSARDRFEQALRIDEAILGTDHHEVQNGRAILTELAAGVDK